MEDPAGSRPFRLEAVYREEIDGAAAAGAVPDLAMRQGVVAIVGPLLSGTAEALLPAAARYSLAVLSPTAAAGGLGTGSPVFFRTCMTMESFAAALADAAATRLGRPAFAILAPAEAYGRAFAGAFRRAVEAHGGSVPLVREYAPGLNDLPAWAAALKKDLVAAGPGGGRPGGVDALFFAGSAQEAGMILPRLAYQGLDPRALAVVGGSALNDPQFPRLAGGYAEGALIADGFFAGSSLPAAKAFAQRYRARHGVDPSAAAAQGCAAVEVLAAALGGGAATARETLAALAALPEVGTVVGPLRVFPGGKTERGPFYSTVRGNALVESPAP
jgi:branched-chain amino acid transport system substrate-binding protein